MSEFKIKVNVDLNVDDVEKQLKQLEKDNKISLSFDDVNFNKIESQLNRIKNTFKSTFKFDKSFIKDINKLNNTLDKLSRSGANTKFVDNTMSKYKDLANTITKLQKQLSKGGLGEESIKRTNEQIEKLKADMKSLYDKMSPSQQKSLELFDFKNTNKSIVDLNNNLNKIDSQIGKLENKANDINIDFLSESSRDELEDVLKKIEEIKVEAKEDIKLEIEVGEALNQLKDVNASLDKLQKEANRNANEYTKTISKQTSGLRKFWDDYKGSIVAYSIGDVLGDFTVDSIRSAISTVMELDTAFTNLRKVSDVPIEGILYESIKSQAIETAKEVGMSSAEVIESIATATQMGAKNIEEASAIAKQSMILANVGEMDSDTASSAVATILNSYNLDALKEIRIQQDGMTKSSTELTNAMDMLNHATNNYAIDSMGLSSALANVGSVLNAYGVSLGDSIGLITAANESMGDPTKVANGLKSIAVNMAGLQTSSKDGSISLNKTAKSLQEIAGIDIYADKKTGKIKDMTVLLDELQAKWHTLSEEEQLALSNAIAGKQNAAVFQALMSNYETFKQIQSEFGEGLHFGSAAKENEQYVDSIAGKLNKLKEIWTSIITTFAKSDFIKGALDGLISLSEVIEKIVSSDIGSFAVGFMALGKTLSSIGSFFGAGKTLGKLFDIGNTANDIMDVANAGGKLTGVFGKTNTGIMNTVKSLGLFGSVGATATTLLTTALVGYIGYVIAADKAQTEARKRRMEERREEISSLKEEIKTEKQKVDSVRDIAKEYDALRSKTNLTAEEQERYLEITRQIAETFPELVSGYDENGDPILKINGSLLTYINNLDRAIAKQEKLLNSEENKQAEDWEERKGEINAREDALYRGNTKVTGVPDPKDAMNGSDNFDNFDAQKYLDILKENIETEEELYDERLKLYEEKEQAIAEIREKARNDLQKDAYYKNASDEDKAEMEAIIDEGNFYNLDESQQKEFINGLAKLDEELVSTTKDLGEHGEAINKAEEDYRNGKNTLDEYTDSVTGAYEAAGKADVESLREWSAAVREYGEMTGDWEGVNRQINQMGDTLEKISGIDDELWEKLLTPNLAPIEDAEKRLDNFLRKYGTGSEHLGKGGLADKLEIEYQALEELPTIIAEEYLKNGKISVPFILEATVDSPTPIKTLVGEIIKDEEITDEEVEVLFTVIADIQNEGEITPETEEKLREILPDEIEDEVIAKIKVSTDAYQEEKVDEFLKTRDELNKDVEAEIRMHVEGTDEAGTLYDYVMKLPEEKRLEFVSNYGLIKDELYMAGVAIDEIPTEVLINMAVNMDKNNIEMVSQLYQQMDGETVTAFLQVDGAIEALAKCETVEEMLTLIGNYNKTGKLEIVTEGEEEVEKTKQTLESTEGDYTVDLMVHTETDDMDYVTGQIYEIDGKQYMCVFNVDTNKNELVEFNGEINSIPEETNTTINVESDTDGIIEAKKEVESISDIEVKPEIEPVVKESGGGIIDKLKNLFGGGKSEPQTIEVEATVSKIDTSEISSAKVEPIDVNAKVSEVDITNINNVKVEPIKIDADSSNAMLKINNIQNGLTSITDKTVKILADSSNATAKITNIQSGLNSISDKTVKILGDSSNAILKINNVEKGLASIPDKTVKILGDSSNAMLKITRVTDGLAGIEDKTVYIKVNAKQAMSAIADVKSSLSGVKSKTVSINVNKTTTNRTVNLKSNARSSSTPMLTNSSLASVPVSASASPLSNTPVTTSESSSLASTPVSAKADNSFGGTLDASKILSSLNFDISHIKNLEEALERLGNQLDLIDEKSEAIFGQEKINLLQQQIPLLKEQQRIQEQIAKNERAQNNELVYWLENKGFTFDNLGNISNYNSKLLEMEQNVESLKEKYDALNSVSGDNKNEEAIKSANKAYESANETLSTTKKYLEEYFTTNNQELLEASKKWWEYENSIRDVEKAIRDLANEQLQNNIDMLGDGIDFLDAKMSAYTGTEKLELINQQNELYRQQQQALHVLAEQQRSQLSLMVQGTQEAVELQREINKLSTEWWDLESAIISNNDAINDYYEDQREAEKEAKKIERENRLNPLRDGLQEIKYELEGINGELSLLETLSERAQGSVKIGYLSDELNVLEEKLITTEEEFSKINKLRQGLMSELLGKGFSFDADGSIFNFDENLGLLAGTEEYEEAKELAEEYMGLLTDDYNENRESIIEIQNSIKDLQNEIEKAERELALFSSKNRLTELNEEFDDLANKLDIIDTKLEYAFGTDKLNLMREEVKLLNDQLDLQSEKIETATKQAQVYTDSLSKYGFAFDDDGSISNYVEVLELFRDDEQIENIKELYEEYMDLQDEIGDLSSEYKDLEKSVKDAYSEMLDTTKDIEDEITKVIEKEYEKRKKEIEDYTDERIKLLEKERKEMQETWNEQDYTKSIKEQSDEIMDLQKRMTILSKDTSIEGQRKLKELAEELAEAQERLEETTQDKIRDDYSNNIDSEIEKLEDEEQSILESLDEKFSDIKIAEMVQMALSSGFIELNGEIKSVQDVLIESINQSAEGYSVMADVIKNELVANLNVALGTMRELSDIYNNLDLSSYGTPVIKNASVELPTSANTSRVVNNNMGDIVLNVSGSMDNATIEQVEEMIRDAQDEMLNKITKDI